MGMFMAKSDDNEAVVAQQVYNLVKMMCDTYLYDQCINSSSREISIFQQCMVDAGHDMKINDGEIQAYQAYFVNTVWDVQEEKQKLADIEKNKQILTMPMDKFWTDNSGGYTLTWSNPADSVKKNKLDTLLNNVFALARCSDDMIREMYQLNDDQNEVSIDPTNFRTVLSRVDNFAKLFSSVSDQLGGEHKVYSLVNIQEQEDVRIIKLSGGNNQVINVYQSKTCAYSYMALLAWGLVVTKRPTQLIGVLDFPSYAAIQNECFGV